MHKAPNQSACTSIAYLVFVYLSMDGSKVFQVCTHLCPQEFLCNSKQHSLGRLEAFWSQGTAVPHSVVNSSHTIIRNECC